MARLRENRTPDGSFPNRSDYGAFIEPLFQVSLPPTFSRDRVELLLNSFNTRATTERIVAVPFVLRRVPVAFFLAPSPLPLPGWGRQVATKWTPFPLETRTEARMPQKGVI